MEARVSTLKHLLDSSNTRADQELRSTLLKELVEHQRLPPDYAKLLVLIGENRSCGKGTQTLQSALHQLSFQHVRTCFCLAVVFVEPLESLLRRISSSYLSEANDCLIYSARHVGIDPKIFAFGGVSSVQPEAERADSIVDHFGWLTDDYADVARTFRKTPEMLEQLNRSLRTQDSPRLFATFGYSHMYRALSSYEPTLMMFSFMDWMLDEPASGEEEAILRNPSLPSPVGRLISQLASNREWHTHSSWGQPALRNTLAPALSEIILSYELI